MDNYGYPWGADNEDAPWNEQTVPDKEFEIVVSHTLVKTCDVFTDKYYPGASGVDWECDEEGGHAVGWHEPDDTSDVDWEEEYKGQHYTPLELIERFRERLEEEYEALKDAKDAEARRKVREIKHLIEECEGWELNESEYEEA